MTVKHLMNGFHLRWVLKMGWLDWVAYGVVLAGTFYAGQLVFGNEVESLLRKKA